MASQTSHRPPKFSEAILGALIKGRPGLDTSGDLAEEFQEVLDRHGSRAARQWYRRQVTRSIGDRSSSAALGATAAVVSATNAVLRLARVRGDLVPAVRSLRRTPWYSVTVVGVVALGLSLATTVFAVVDGVIFKPLPYSDASRLVSIELGFHDREGVRGGSVLPGDLDAWQAAMPDVPITSVRVTDETGLERVNEPSLGLALIRPNLLDVLGVQPLLGGFSQDDWDLLAAERPPIRPVLITYEFWQSRFDGAVGAVGRLIEPADPLSTTPFRIAGVLPEGFVVPAVRSARLVMPSPGSHARRPDDTTILARLPEGLTPDVFVARLEAAMPYAAETTGRNTRGGVFDRAIVQPLESTLQGDLGPVFRRVLVAIGVLLLIACLNLSGLMTARCLDRAREIGLRQAIGAGASDVIRLVLVEHALLFAVGACVAVAASGPLLHLTLGLLPTDLYLLKTPMIDGRVFAFAAVAMMVSLGLASVWPLHRALRPGLQAMIIDGGGAVTSRLASLGTRAVTMGQITGAVLLVVAGGLLVGSLLQVQTNEMGYDADNVVVAELGVAPWLEDGRLFGDWGAARIETRERLTRFLDRLRATAGIDAAGAVEVNVLTGGLSYRSRFDPVGRDSAVEEGAPPRGILVGASAGLNIPVTPGFLEAAGVAVLDGRLPTDEELRTGAPVVAVSRSFARDRFGDQRAVGEFVQHKPERELPLFEIVGVVEDQRIAAWDAPASSTVFTPYVLFGGLPGPVVFVRGVRGGRVLVADVLRLIEEERPILRPVRVQAATAMLGDTIRVRRLQSWLFGAFAVSGLVLAGVGLLGVVAMGMARRTREVGIRMALGATRERVVSGLMREHLTPVALGLAAGGLLSVWAVRFLESYLYELSVYDVRVWSAACVVVVLTAVTGALIPALRASRVDPVRALRE